MSRLFNTHNTTDAGLTGDKVKVSDPAAAPLETDQETAGTPLPPRLMQAVFRHQQAMSAPFRRRGEAAYRANAVWGFSSLAILVALGLLLAWL